MEPVITLAPAHYIAPGDFPDTWSNVQWAKYEGKNPSDAIYKDVKDEDAVVDGIVMHKNDKLVESIIKTSYDNYCKLPKRDENDIRKMVSEHIDGL